MNPDHLKSIIKPAGKRDPDMNKITGKIGFLHTGKCILISAIFLLTGSCIAPSKFIVTRIGEEPKSYTERYVYSLPMTHVLVKLEYEVDRYIPGPYKIYSNKYLGIPDFIDKSESRYRIVNADLTAFMEPDPMQYYSVNILKGSLQDIPFIELSNQGLILNPNQGIKMGSAVENPDEKFTPPYFTDLSEEEYFVEHTDTMYKTIIKDSAFITIPVMRKQRDAKTLEQKAEEAANFIIQIRKRRFKLEAGDYDVFPEGIALETAVRELNKLEMEYISLFVGKILTRKYTRSYFLTPSGKDETITFAKFSASRGILPADASGGDSVLIRLQPLGTTGILKDNLPQQPEAERYNTLYYRIPEVTSVRLLHADKLLYESRFTVFQGGSLISIPLKAQ
jgi:hypothetical protein